MNCPKCDASAGRPLILTTTGLRDDENEEELLAYVCPNCRAVLGYEVDREDQMQALTDLVCEIHRNMPVK